jgi:hypothetical protein
LWYFFREEIASNRIDYRITKQLNGDIAIHQPSLRGNNVSSKENVMFEVKLHDPSGNLKFDFGLVNGNYDQHL